MKGLSHLLVPFLNKLSQPRMLQATIITLAFATSNTFHSNVLLCFLSSLHYFMSMVVSLMICSANQ